MSILCVATIIFQHCLNPLGHGVHQSFTGCHWSCHWSIMELVDVRDLALLHLPFEDAPKITFTLSFFSKVVVVLEVCLASLSCCNTALRLSLRRDGINLCFIMSQYMLAFMVPSMKLAPHAGSTYAAPEHDTPTTMLDCVQDIHSNYFCWGFATSFRTIAYIWAQSLQLCRRHSAASGSDTKHRRANLDSHGYMVSCCFQQRAVFYTNWWTSKI